MNLNYNKKILLVAVLFTSILLVNPVLAAEKKDKASRRAQQMIQQIQLEKTQLQAQLEQALQAKAAIEADLAKTRSENVAMKSKLAASNVKIDSLESSLKGMTTERMAFEAKLLKTEVELQSTKTALSEEEAKYHASVYDLKVNEQQRANLTAISIQKTKLIDLCVAKNNKLYDYSFELVKLYENPSEYKKVVLTEPFSQLKRVQLENILQDYNDKINEQQLKNNN
jgi:chromosome segregation ATPase